MGVIGIQIICKDLGASHDRLVNRGEERRSED